MTFPNQCAIRMSRCLIKSGWTKDTFRDKRYTGNICPHGYARGAQDLAAFLRKIWGSQTVGWSAQKDNMDAFSNSLNKKGIICFMNIPGFAGQGHIDLWDGTKSKPVERTRRGQYWHSSTIWLWVL